MQKKQKVVGVDGCRGEWIACALTGEKIEIDVFKNWRQLIEKHKDSKHILVDIPIGLSDNHFTRTVDRALRAALSERKSSVFTPPCRAAVYSYTYDIALQKNRSILGKGISKQAFYLAPKIRELDDYLGRKIKRWPLCYESHPELNFQLLNGNRPLRHSKKEEAGRSERWNLIHKHNSALADASSTYFETEKSASWQKDDLLDAACLSIVAGQEKMRFIEDTSKKDHRGIFIKIACYDK